jgi:hypothetical protein
MLDGRRVLVVAHEEASGRAIAESLMLVKADIAGPYTVAGTPEAIADPDLRGLSAAVIEMSRVDEGVSALLARLTAERIPLVICAPPTLLPEFRGQHPAISVLPLPTLPLRILSEVAVLIERRDGFI